MLNEGSSFISVWNKEQEEAEQDNPTLSANTRTHQLAPEKNRGEKAVQQSQSTWRHIWQVCERFFFFFSQDQLPTRIEMFIHFLLTTVSMEAPVTFSDPHNPPGVSRNEKNATQYQFILESIKLD